ncbi:MAG: hypothetical protein H6680_08310 [Desulfobacteraceae bacterium]|nr:hypothetical protein [Desulfobacteraceae bacterium]
MAAIFKRGITNENFINALKDSFNNNGLWKKILEDKDIAIGIRDNYINIYYQGNSILKLGYSNNKISTETHYKYLLSPAPSKGKSVLIKTETSSFFEENTDEFIKNYFITKRNDIKALKKSSSVYGGVEKEGIQKILKSNNNIIDLEIALTHEDETIENHLGTGNRKTAKRIDFAAIQSLENNYELVFVEAKDFSNKELRANDDNVPVLNQIAIYEELLEKYKDDILNSYKLICKNLCEIIPQDILMERYGDFVEKIANGADLKLNTSPCLAVFGFDQDQRDGKVWSVHKKKLEDKLGSKRLLLKGNPSDFKGGISAPK